MISAASVGGFWQQSHGEDHGPGVAVSSPEAAKNTGRLSIFGASPLPLCIVSISRGSLQATPALPCNTQPYVHTAALPAPLAAKQPLCLPLWSVSPHELSSTLARELDATILRHAAEVLPGPAMTTDDLPATQAPSPAPPHTTNPHPSADAIVGGSCGRG
ncbi:hypothetical protein PMIN06_006475 [Paraphaeosphaeria minitans]